MLRIETKTQPPVGAPVELVHRHPLALECEQHREVPAQNVCAQVAPTGDDGVDEVAQSFRQSIVSALGYQAHAAVDVPAQYEYRALRLRDRLADGGEVFGAIDEDAETPRACDAPAIASGRENAHSRACRATRDLIHRLIPATRGASSRCPDFQSTVASAAVMSLTVTALLGIGARLGPAVLQAPGARSFRIDSEARHRVRYCGSRERFPVGKRLQRRNGDVAPIDFEKCAKREASVAPPDAVG